MAPSERSSTMVALRVLMMRDLHNLLRNMPNGSIREQRAWLTETIHLLVTHYGSEFRAIALNELEAVRADRAMTALPLIVAETVNQGQTSAAVGWALSMKDLTSALEGATLRLAQKPARESVYRSAVAAGTGFARLCSADACDFCTMLASRGAVYLSADTAERTGNSRIRPEAKQAPGSLFHDNCNCEVVEVRNARDLPQLSLNLAEQWEEATKGKSGNLFEEWKKYRAERYATPVAA